MPETEIAEILSADPIGPLTLGQGRTAVQGDILANLDDFAGLRVTRECYVNDVGQRAASLADATRLCIQSDPDTSAPRFDALVRALAEGIAGQFGRRQLSDAEWSNVQHTVLPRLVLEYQKRSLDRLDVRFDAWFEERSLTADAVRAALERLGPRLREGGGSLWMEDETGEREVLQRDSGAFTFLAMDLAYHVSKIERGARRILNVWGPAYHRHRGRLRRALSAMEIDTPVEVVLVAPTRLQSDGAPIRYLDPATLQLDPLLDHVPTSTLRWLLNAAPPEEELLLDMAVLNGLEQDGSVLALHRQLRHLGVPPAAANGDDLRQLISGWRGDPNPETARLQTLTSSTLDVVERARVGRRPDLLNGHLSALVDASVDAIDRIQGAPARQSVGAALGLLTSLIGLAPETV